MSNVYNMGQNRILICLAMNIVMKNYVLQHMRFVHSFTLLSETEQIWPQPHFNSFLKPKMPAWSKGT